MRKHSANVYFSILFCLALSMVLTMAGFGLKNLEPIMIVAAEKNDTAKTDFANIDIVELRVNSIYGQITEAAEKAEPNADLGTFERKVSGEIVKASKTTTNDGSFEVHALFYDKTDKITGEMIIVYIPCKDEYDIDATYIVFENGNAVLKEFLRRKSSNLIDADPSDRSDNEFIRSCTLMKDSVTVWDGFSDTRRHFTSNRKKQGNSIVEECEEYWVYEDGTERLFSKSTCYTTEYEVIEGQKFAKSFCTVSTPFNNASSTYLCIMDEYVEDGINYATRCFAWDGSDIYGNGDGDFETFAFRYMQDKDGKRSLLDSTSDANFKYVAPDDKTLDEEELYGVFHDHGDGTPVKTFSYTLYGNHFESVRGGFAKMRSDLPLVALDGELAKRLLNVATNDAEDEMIYAGNLMIIEQESDGSTKVFYNSYDNSEADTTTSHKYTYRIDSKGNKEIIETSQSEVALTIPQVVFIMKKDFEADASEIAKGDVSFKLAPFALGKTKCRKVSGDENIKVNKKGKVTIAKGTYEPGTVLKFKVKVIAAEILHGSKTKKNFKIKVTIK